MNEPAEQPKPEPAAPTPAVEVQSETQAMPAIVSDVEAERAARKKRSNTIATVVGVVVVVVVGIFLIASLMSGISGSRTVRTTKKVEEGDFTIPDSKVVEFENFRKTVSKQVDEMLALAKGLKTDSEVRNDDMKALRRQVAEANALGSDRTNDEITEDLKTFPEALRDLVPAAVEELDRDAISTGNISYSDALPSFNPWVRSKIQTATDQQIEALARVAQVRRKPLTDAQYLTSGDIAVRRAALGIPRDNIPAIVKLIWSRRATLPAMTAGQMLSLAVLASQTTQDVSGAPIVEGGSGPATTKAHETVSPWTMAASGQVELPGTVAMGPLVDTPERLREAVRIIIPMLVDECPGLKLSRDDGIRGAAFAIMLSDARVNAALVAGHGDPDAITVALNTIETDVKTGSEISVPLEVSNVLHAQDLGIEAMVALRASYVGAVAAQNVLNASEPHLDQQILAGLIRPPPQDMITAAISAHETKDNAHIYTIFSAVLRRSDGSSVYPLEYRTALSRVRSMLPTLDEVERVIAHETIGGASSQQLAEFHRLGLVALALACLPDTRTAEHKKIQEPALQNLARLAIYIGSMAGIDREVRTVMVPRYARNYLTLAIDWDALGDRVRATTRQTVLDAASGELVQSTAAADIAAAIGSIKRTAIPLAEGMVNRAVVREIVLGAIAESSIGRERLLVDGVHEYMDAQIERLVVPDYTDDRVRTIAGTVARDCIAILTGRRNLPRRRVSANEESHAVVAHFTGNGGAHTVGTGAWGTQDLSVMDVGPKQEQGGGYSRPMAGPASQNFQAITLQSGSYGEAYIWSGTEGAAGTTQKRTVLINLNHSWKGTGSVIRMRDMRILGDAYPLTGSTNRMLVDLKRISFRFPDGRLVERECQGYVTDSIQGRDGLVAEYHLNLGELGPMAAAVGVFTGFGTALQAVTQPVNSTALSVVSNSNGTPPQAGGTISPTVWAAGAASGAAAPVASYLTRAMSAISPTLVVENGQPVSVVLSMPVIFDGVPKAEWESITESPENAASLFP